MKVLVTVFSLLIACIGQSQINSQFVSMRPIYPNMVTFNYTGSIQTWTVPAGVTYVFIEAFGAQGGSGGTNVGGRGGKITCTLPVTPGQVLFITVGGQSTNQTALYGFGGNGGVATSYGTFARAGGGLSGVSSANPITQANAFLIAGGGGGTPTSSFAGAGGASGGLDGLAGSSIYGGVSTRGGGASQTSGGVAGTPYDSNTILPTTGSAIFGGEGGTVSGISPGWNGGGGGGAGYFGGGGGAGGGNAQGSGGGGSSWTSPSCLNVQNIGDINTGHGYVNIHY